MSELEYVEKSLPAIRLAQLTDDAGSQREMTVGLLFDRARACLDSAGLPADNPAYAWYQSTENGTHYGVGFPVTVDTVDGVEVVDHPAHQRGLTVLHYGGMDTIGDTWQALVTEVERRGLTVNGPGREVYLETPMESQDHWVTELQQPVE